MDQTTAFLAGAYGNEEFSEGLQIVQANSRGKVWLIGGFVYRTITHRLYGTAKPEVDLDFIVESPTAKITLPQDWRVSQNRFGNPKFINENKQIDFVPLANIYMLLQRKLAPTIENFLSITPLGIQSIAYDATANMVIGPIGIDAIERKIIEVNDLPSAKYAAKKKKLTLYELIRQKAKSLEFTPIYP
jgi:hypothetical protein